MADAAIQSDLDGMSFDPAVIGHWELVLGD